MCNECDSFVSADVKAILGDTTNISQTCNGSGLFIMKPLFRYTKEDNFLKKKVQICIIVSNTDGLYDFTLVLTF